MCGKHKLQATRMTAV